MHKTLDTVRYWKDPEYRARMKAQGVELAHPAGLVELSDERLTEASGFAIGPVLTTAITCTEYSWRGWKYCCP